MSVPKYKALLLACITLFLCGCGQALSEREIVRAVFFARQQGQYSVCLLLADQNNNEDGLHYKTSSARGFTAAQALHRAETTLPGRLYYGLIDLAVLANRPRAGQAALRQSPARARAFGLCAGYSPPQLGGGCRRPV